MNTCRICSHEQRAAIDACLVKNQPIRDIASQFDLSRSAVDRHKKHIPKALTLAKQAEEVADATSLLSRVERIMSRCESLADKAEAKGKWSGAVAAFKEMRACLELIGKLSGELQQGGGTQVNVGVVVENGKGAIVGTDQLFTTAAMSEAQLNYMLSELGDGTIVEEESQSDAERRREWHSRSASLCGRLRGILQIMDQYAADPAMRDLPGGSTGMLVRRHDDPEGILVHRHQTEQVVAALRTAYELLESRPW